MLGDPRPGVGLILDILPLRADEKRAYPFNSLRAGEIRLWEDKPEHKGLPDIVWVNVPGSKGEVEFFDEDHKSYGTFSVQPFYIAKYPITYMQFEAFVKAEDGFRDKRWWDAYLSAEEGHNGNPGEQSFKVYNRPRDNVSWYDAVAFCRWLNARLGFAELPEDLTIKTLENFKGLRLPAEWEWQWAATGGGDKAYLYPWGAEWDENKTNTSESSLRRTTAVGMYPTGSAPCGALDLSGNVWEWCLNEYEKPENIGLGSRESRVVRGGSWLLAQVFARASSRLNDRPYGRHSDFGFRLVARPPSL